MPFVTGNKIAILNVYDGCIFLTDAPTHFSEYIVNGVSYASVNELQEALLDVIYTRLSLSGGGGGTLNTIPRFSATGLEDSLLSQSGNQINLGTYAAFGVNNPGTPGDPGVDNDAYIGSIINNDFLVKVNNTEALRIDTALRLKIANIQNATYDTDKFLVSDGGIVKYRTGAELLSDIGGASAGDLSGYVPYTGATANVNLNTRSLTLQNVIATIVPGSSQDAIQGFANNGSGIRGVSNNGSGVRGESTIGVGGSFTSGSSSTTGTLEVVNTSTGFLANFYSLGFVLRASISNLGDITGNSFIKSGGTSSQFLKADGSVDNNTYLTSSSLTNYVTLDSSQTITGAKDFTALLTGTRGGFLSSGSNNTFAINHSSGSGIALNINKAGNGEGLYVNKTSGSGNAATIIGTLNATTLVKSGGTSSQFLMADGSVNTNVLASGAYLPLSGGTLTGALNGTSATFSGNVNLATSSGNVGIGTATPESLTNNTTLQIDGVNHSFVRTGTSVYGGYFSTIPTADVMVLSNVRNPVTGSFSNTGKASSVISLFGASNDGYLTFSTSNSNNTAPTERMRITSGGNLLIGTDADTGLYKLDVNGTGRFSGVVTSKSNTYNGFIADNNSTTGGGYFIVRQNGNTLGGFAASGAFEGNTDSNIAIYAESSKSIKFYTNGSATPRLTIASTGAATFTNLAGTGSRAVLADANGLLSAPVSDISVKENIQSIGYGLNEIVKMNPVWFDFVDDYKNYGEGRQNGNIAQEMQKIIPEAVFTTPSTGKMGINYDQLHAVYIKAIQELKAEIELLKNK
jgi:hypothetical protein